MPPAAVDPMTYHQPTDSTIYVDTLARFIDVLHLGRPHLLGLSLGGILAIALHGRHPDVARSLVLASGYAGWAGSLPPAEVQRRVQGVLRDLEWPVDEVAREFVATLLPPDAPAPLVQEQLAMVHDARPATTKTMLAMIAPVDLRPVLPKIDVPALLLYGEADVRARLRLSPRRSMARSAVRCWSRSPG